DDIGNEKYIGKYIANNDRNTIVYQEFEPIYASAIIIKVLGYYGNVAMKCGIFGIEQKLETKIEADEIINEENSIRFNFDWERTLTYVVVNDDEINDNTTENDINYELWYYNDNINNESKISILENKINVKNKKIYSVFESEI